MEKITLTKKVIYYNKDKFINAEIIEKRFFTNITEAIQFMKNYNLKYVINRKGISALEELEILHQADYKTFIKYYKTVNFNTLEEKDNIDNIEHGRHEAHDELI